jgi:hypothetical protein
VASVIADCVLHHPKRKKKRCLRKMHNMKSDQMNDEIGGACNIHRETKCAYEVLVGKFEMNGLLGELVYVWWGQYLRFMKKGTLTQDRVQWRLPVSATVNSGVRNFLTS